MNMSFSTHKTQHRYILRVIVRIVFVKTTLHVGSQMSVCACRQRVSTCKLTDVQMSFLLSQLALSSELFTQCSSARLVLTAARLVMFAAPHLCYDQRTEEEKQLSCRQNHAVDLLPAYGTMHHVMHASLLGSTHIKWTHITF